MGRSKKIILKAVHSFFQIFIDFVYPPFCFLCDKKLESESLLLCKDCWNKQPKMKETYLPAEKMPYIPGPVKWMVGSFACFQYSEITQEFIHFFKYKKFEELSFSFAAELAKVLDKSSTHDLFDLLVPIPLHKNRLKERGFNQSELLAKALSEQTRIPVNKNSLVRIRYTQPQAKMSRKERIKNVKGAFQLKGSLEIKNKTILLVDDVLTTGSTMNECAKILKSGGAHKVYSLTITRI
jgi:competence protein ComFC